MTNDEKKYRTAADALYGLRDWATEKQKEYASKPCYVDVVGEHMENCERCTSDAVCPKALSVATGASDDSATAWAFGRVASEIDEALRNVFGSFQKDRPLYDPWDGEIWTFFNTSGKGLTVMRDGQGNLNFPDIDVLDIAGQLLLDMLFATGINFTWKTEIEVADGQSVVIAEGVGGHLKTYHYLAVVLAQAVRQGGWSRERPYAAARVLHAAPTQIRLHPRG